MNRRTLSTRSDRRCLRGSSAIHGGLATLVVLTLAFSTPSVAQPSFDYHRPTQQLVERGTQAFMICNGLFTSGRTLDQIYRQELRLNMMPVLPPTEVEIDKEARTVTVGVAGNDSVPVMRAAYRDGFGCMTLSPAQTFADLGELPSMPETPFAGDAETIPWPDGDLVAEEPLPSEIDAAALQAASDWAFDRETHGHTSQITASVLVVHRGRIVHERYAEGFDRTTRTRTWSTAKSLAATLIGLRIAEGELELDQPLAFDDWGPVTGPDDPRRQITLRNALHMATGLYPIDNDRCAVTGSCLSYWAGDSSVAGSLDRGAVRAPGVHWDYENYDTLLAVRAFEKSFASQADYHAYARTALFEKIGMRSTMPGVDRFGHFILSSQVYTNARDLARMGLLHLWRGQWDGEQILPESWVDFVRTPAPSTKDSGAFYGGQWWLVPDDRTDIPADAYSTAGNRGQYTVVVPSHDLVIVRRGLDWLPGMFRFSQWDLTREVLKAFPKQPAGEKPSVDSDR
ncbi:MAG: serine hydrolase [Acidobacteriota bacterium]